MSLFLLVPLVALLAACSVSSAPPGGAGSGGGEGGAAGAAGSGGGAAGNGCLSCAPPEDGGSASSVSAHRFDPAGCFSAASTALCGVCMGTGPNQDAGIAPGSHCIVGPGLDAYYLVTQPVVWSVAPGWYVSDTLVGVPVPGAGTPTPEQTAACDALQKVVPTMPPPDAGIFPSFNTPAPCK